MSGFGLVIRLQESESYDESEAYRKVIHRAPSPRHHAISYSLSGQE